MPCQRPQPWQSATSAACAQPSRAALSSQLGRITWLALTCKSRTPDSSASRTSCLGHLPCSPSWSGGGSRSSSMCQRCLLMLSARQCLSGWASAHPAGPIKRPFAASRHTTQACSIAGSSRSSIIAADEPHAGSERPSGSTTLCTRLTFAQSTPASAGSVTNLLQQMGPEVCLRIQLAAPNTLTT